ncbi:MAG: hypothetical protein LC798_03035 [Chloroflexi bacterium]|nr:hypothetical protein [Chloroflexota bacterium]
MTFPAGTSLRARPAALVVGAEKAWPAGAVPSSAISLNCADAEPLALVAVVSMEMATLAPPATSEEIHATGLVRVRVAWSFRNPSQRYSTSLAAFSSPEMSSQSVEVCASGMSVVLRYFPREVAPEPAVVLPAVPVVTV